MICSQTQLCFEIYLVIGFRFCCELHVRVERVKALLYVIDVCVVGVINYSFLKMSRSNSLFHAPKLACVDAMALTQFLNSTS